MSATSLLPRLESEPCSWDAASDNFHCDFLSPGAYKLTFGMDGWPDPKIGVQKAEVVVEVKAQKQPQPELMVHLKKWDSAPKLKESLAETDFLHVKRVCGRNEGTLDRGTYVGSNQGAKHAEIAVPGMWE